MITRFRVKNYKALRDVELDLTPIHVLIGPNDTGKTSLLEAMRALCRSVDRSLVNSFVGDWQGRQLVWKGEQAKRGTVELSATIDDGALAYTLVCTFDETASDVWVHGETLAQKVSEQESVAEGFSGDKGVSSSLVCRSVSGGFPPKKKRELWKAVRENLIGVRFHRWIPERLAVPVAPYGQAPFTLETSGFGLALCLSELLRDDWSNFAKLEERFCEIFPEIKRVKLPSRRGFRFAGPEDPSAPFPRTSEADGIGLECQLRSGAIIPSSQLSDGMLLVLAYLTILKSPNPPRILLIEEPENGVHPKMLKEVLSILRDLVKEQDHTQIVMTTHSPYALDLFAPEEVTLCTKGNDGAVNVRRLSESKVVRDQIDAFTLGEIWTAEGDEALAQPADADQEVAK